MNERSYVYRLARESLRLAGNPRFLAPCVAGAFMLVVGTILGVQYTFNMAAVLFALPVASYILAALSLRGLNISRSKWSSAVEGEEVEFAIRLEVSGVAPRLGLRLIDSMPSVVVSDAAEGIGVAVCSVGAVIVPYSVRPMRRGVYSIGPIEVASKDPIGIFEYKRSFGQRCELAVYPRPQPVPISTFFGSQGQETEDMRTVGRKGQGMEFHGVRDYAPGDPLRHIHWKTTARRGDLVVAEFEQSAATGVTIAMELGRGTERPADGDTSVDTAVRIAAYVAEKALSVGLPVSLLLPSGRTVSSYSASCGSDREQILYALAKANADSELSLSEALRVCHVPVDQAVVLITPAVDQQLAQEIVELRGSGTTVSLIVVGADDPAFDEEVGSLLESVDCETIIEAGGGGSA